MYMATRCGAWQVGDAADQGEVEFRVFFPAGFDPHVVSISVVGDFQVQLGGVSWDPITGLPLSVEAPDPRGTFWSAVTPVPLLAGFYQYKLYVTFDSGETRWVTDPCARYSGLADQNSGIVVGGSSPAENAVRPIAGGRRPLVDLNVYEVMIDDFTDDYRGTRAPLAAVTDKLDYLRELGFTAILFMPWTAWAKPDFDWGYVPRGFFAVESRYANDLDQPAEKLSWLKRLISACHDRGLHVIMDGVFNHVSPDFPYRQLYRDAEDCPFTGTFGGSFHGLQDLDFGNDCTDELIDDVCRYWTDVFGIDGIRFDNTVNYHVPGEMRGLPQVLEHLADHVAAKGEENFSLTIEHIDVSAARITNETVADSFWDKSLHEVTWAGLWTGGTTDARLLSTLNNRRFLAPGKVPTLYLSNHDHAHVAFRAGAATEQGAVGTWWRTQPYLIALFTSTAVPLVPNGQEFGEEYFIPEFDDDTGRRVRPRPLRWKLATDKIGVQLLALHRRLARIRLEHPALRSAEMFPAAWDGWRFDDVGVGVDVERQLAVYHRWAETADGVENVVVVLNFSGRDQVVEAPFPYGGRWEDLLAGFAGGPGWGTDVAGWRAPVPVGSHFGRVLLGPA
jgi:1,4-alpha-glucan branching enzyme